MTLDLTDYTTVLKLGEDFVLEDDKEKSFAGKEELEALLRSGKEHKVLYFLRASGYQVHHDFPVRGASREVLTSVHIAGPFPSSHHVAEPSVSESRRYEEKLITRLVPADSSISTGRVALLSICVQQDHDYRSFLTQTKTIDLDQLMATGQDILARIKAQMPLEEKQAGVQTFYRGNIDGCVLEFEIYSRNGSFPFTFPSVSLNIFGADSQPIDLANSFGVDKLAGAFTHPEWAELGLKKCIQRGIAYDLSFENRAPIRKILELENVVL